MSPETAEYFFILGLCVIGGFLITFAFYYFLKRRYYENRNN